VAEFLYFTGFMDCGKSTLALQFDHTHTAGGRKSRPAVEVGPAFKLLAPRRGRADRRSADRLPGLRRDAVLPAAADRPAGARIVDELQIDVLAVGMVVEGDQVAPGHPGGGAATLSDPLPFDRADEELTLREA